MTDHSLVRIRPGKYSAAVIERPNGKREQTGWFRWEFGKRSYLLPLAIEHRLGPSCGTGRLLYIIHATTRENQSSVDRPAGPPRVDSG